MANSVDPDGTPHPASSHLGLHCLLRPVGPYIYGKYGRSYTPGERVSRETSWIDILDLTCFVASRSDRSQGTREGYLFCPKPLTMAMTSYSEVYYGINYQDI